MKKRIIGLMAGTSYDGIDIADTIVEERRSNFSFNLLKFKTYKYPPELKKKLIGISKATTIDDISKLNFYIGDRFASSVLQFCREEQVKPSQIDLVGSHGQTIYHQPNLKMFLKKNIRSTLQIGEPSVIAEKTRITTVADFRPRDIAAGGLGAPLTTQFHFEFFKNLKRNILVNNIGGISNVTFIPKDGDENKVLGFDTGPGNMLIDLFTRKFYPAGPGYDRNGRIAKNGKTIPKLIYSFMHHPFITQKPPKTSGREDFGLPYAKKILENFSERRKEDIIHTATLFTARSIATNYKKFIFPKYKIDEVVLTGGGAKNIYLKKLLSKELPNIKISTFNDYGINVDAVEAVAFAFLAFKTFLHEPSNIPRTTGAKRKVILGKIIPA